MEILLRRSPGSGPYGLTEGLTSPQKRESICSFFLRAEANSSKFILGRSPGSGPYAWSDRGICPQTRSST